MFVHSRKKINVKGFTLIEMLVSVALFSVVMLVSVSVILSIIGGNKKAQAINSVVNNLNFSIESMIRDMKTGYFYRCDPDNYSLSNFTLPTDESQYCTNTTTAYDTVAFMSTLSGTPTAVEYSYNEAEGRIYKSDEHATYPLTSPEVNITSVKFYMNSPAPGSEVQPSIFILIAGTATVGEQVSDFNLQTFVSQRILNVGFGS